MFWNNTTCILDKDRAPSKHHYVSPATLDHTAFHGQISSGRLHPVHAGHLGKVLPKFGLSILPGFQRSRVSRGRLPESISRFARKTVRRDQTKSIVSHSPCLYIHIAQASAPAGPDRN